MPRPDDHRDSHGVIAVLDDLGARARHALPATPPPPRTPAVDPHGGRRGLEWVRLAAASVVVALAAAGLALALGTGDRRDEAVTAGQTDRPGTDPDAGNAPGPAGAVAIPAVADVPVADLVGLDVADAIRAADRAGHGLMISLVVADDGDPDGQVTDQTYPAGTPVPETTAVEISVPVRTQTRDGEEPRRQALVDLARSHPDTFAGIVIESRLTPTRLSIRPGASYGAVADDVVAAAGYLARGAMPSTLELHRCLLAPDELRTFERTLIGDGPGQVPAGQASVTADPGTCQLRLWPGTAPDAPADPIDAATVWTTHNPTLSRLGLYIQLGGEPPVVSEFTAEP